MAKKKTAMNAIIALCHFCEAHGPCPIFCTHTLRDLKIDEIATNAEALNEHCPGCCSIGRTAGMLSEDTESNANFLSTQTSILVDVVSLVKQAAVRSLSCEVTYSIVPNHTELQFFFFSNFHRHSVEWQQGRKSCIFRWCNTWPCTQLHISNTRFTSPWPFSALLGRRSDER